MPNVSPIYGLVFVTESGDEYGIIREGLSQIEHPVSAMGLEHLADDESGNAFASKADGSIVFWDHETDGITKLASNWDDFVACCSAPRPVELDEEDVLSAWVDPEFAKDQGIEAPPDGWIKKPKQ
ncbi:MAG: SMI1/KNR4 family protein [Woeseiaceae bacterium]|nr:SMI1/KNR4 family protein [Woeseiaceae bacterium]MDX2608674.1 SMI1/KNR4 family protein [Woeseiaceae bacterium]